jgi:hypothetical protein
LLNQHYALYLLIEKTAFAWYYVITARETNKNKQHKPKTKGGKNNDHSTWNRRSLGSSKRRSLLHSKKHLIRHKHNKPEKTIRRESEMLTAALYLSIAGVGLYLTLR